MQVENLSLKTIFNKNGIFLFGNNVLFINSFLSLIKKFFHKEYKFYELDNIKNYSSFTQNELFEQKQICFIINNLEDKQEEQFYKIIKSFKFIAIQGHFLKSRNIAQNIQKKSDVLSIPFFKNSPLSYIMFLLQNMGYSKEHGKTILNEHLKTEEDPVTIIQKLSEINFHVSANEQKHKFQYNVEPIPLIKILMSNVKKSYSNMDFLLNKKVYTDQQLIETFLNLEIDYKSYNLKSLIFLQKEFL